MDSSENIDEALLAPVPNRDWALFLDIDGTLIDIADRPDTVVVPDDLAATLEMASQWLTGALAVVSGRTLATIDRLLSPLTLPCAAEHGAVMRLPDGSQLQPGARRPVPPCWRETIRAAASNWPGVLVGNKSYSVAVHYRLAPDREADVYELVQGLVAGDPEFEVLPARMAFEIRHRGLNKGEAVRQFMAVPPFAGRTPVVVGDDVTDEDGFAAAHALGGLGLHVGDSFGGRPANVRSWLRNFAD